MKFNEDTRVKIPVILHLIRNRAAFLYHAIRAGKTARKRCATS